MKTGQMIVTWALMGCLIPFLTGCSDLANCTLTGCVWRGVGTIDHCEPTPNPNLSVYQTADRRDFLVIYNEKCAETGAIKRRAYLLNANEKRMESGRSPRFIRVRHMDCLQTVPVESCSLLETISLPEPNGEIATGLRAVLLSDAQHFTLVSDNRGIASFCLPVYMDRGGQAWRIALTPLTVTADVAIYSAAAVAVLSLCALTHSGDDDDGPSLTHHDEHDKDKDKDKKERSN